MEHRLSFSLHKHCCGADKGARWVTKTNLEPDRPDNKTEILEGESGGDGLGDGSQLPGGRRVRQDLQGAVRCHAAGKEAAGRHQGAAGQRAD